jgi:hypothetical protein
MRRRLFRAGAWFLPAILMIWLVMPATVRPASYWFHGVRGRDVSVCFAGNAVTQRPVRVREVVGHLMHFQYAANIKLLALSGKSLDFEAGPTGTLANLGCPAPTQQSNGNSYYAGDVRIALWSTNVDVSPPGKVPGVGCTQDKKASSWSNPPDELEVKRACQYNLVLGDDGDAGGTPYLNHSLHEFGHALGSVHEHARTDENAQCVPTTHDEYHTLSAGFMTPYDKDSVMHYWWPKTTLPNCQQTGSNYSHAGFTGYDRLALHITYPEDARVVEFVGDTVIRTGEPLQLGSAWQAQGVNMGFVAKNWAWRIDGIVRSTSPTLAFAGLSAGTHTLSVEHDDYLDRHYTYSGKVEVLAPAVYAQRVAAANAGRLVLQPIISLGYAPALFR